MNREFGKIFIVVCSLAFLASGSHAKDDKKISKKRIINGQVIQIGHAPYIVQLRDPSGTLLCGGTLVTDQHVVTAAHCLDFIDARDFYTVVGGASTSTDEGVQRRVTAFFTPEAYTRQTFDSDVAVLKLESPMTGDYIRPIPLYPTSLKDGEVFQVSGWGRTEPNGPVSHQLHSFMLRSMPRAKCISSFSHITDTMFCGLQPGSGPCQYDSGGPAVRNGQLCGIVSWGKSSCKYEADVPAVYTNVAAVRGFIENAIRQ